MGLNISCDLVFLSRIWVLIRQALANLELTKKKNIPGHMRGAHRFSSQSEQGGLDAHCNPRPALIAALLDILLTNEDLT
jgi:hypothetical protein